MSTGAEGQARGSAGDAAGGGRTRNEVGDRQGARGDGAGVLRAGAESSGLRQVSLEAGAVAVLSGALSQGGRGSCRAVCRRLGGSLALPGSLLEACRDNDSLVRLHA